MGRCSSALRLPTTLPSTSATSQISSCDRGRAIIGGGSARGWATSSADCSDGGRSGQVQQPDGLISGLLDERARQDERWDAIPFGEDRKGRGRIVMDDEPAWVPTVASTCAFPMIPYSPSHL